MFVFADRSIVADKERRREIKIVLKKLNHNTLANKITNVNNQNIKSEF